MNAFIWVVENQKLIWWWQFQRNENYRKRQFFFLNNDHSTSKLMFTKIAVKKFIFKKNYDFYFQNVNLSKIYIQCLLRRIHVFKKFFDSSKIINSNLSRVKAIMMNCKFDMKKMKTYKIKELKFMNDVIQIDKKKIRSKWSFAMQRKMQITACWIFLLELKNQNVDIKFAKIKKWLIRSNVMNAWLLMLRFMFVFQLHDKFHFACRENSKLQILLRNIRSQMSLTSIWKYHFLLSFFFTCEKFLHVKNFYMFRSFLFVLRLHVNDFHKLQSLKNFLNIIFLLTTW